MPWCIANIEALWNTTQDLAVGTDAPSSVDFTLQAPWTIEEFVALANDRDRAAGYLWSFQDGCLCVEGPEVELAIPSIKWRNGRGTSVTGFAEISKEQATKLADLDVCFTTVFGCPFSEYASLWAANNTKRISTAHAEGFVGGSNPAFGNKFNATVTKPSTGRYTVTFGTPHPLGDSYPITLSPVSSEVARDGVHIEVEKDSVTATGFNLWIGTGDNGATADVLVDTTFSFHVGGIESDVVTAT